MFFIIFSKECIAYIGGKTYNTIIVEDKTSDFYINDFANIFTEEQKQEIMLKAKELNDTYNGMQVVVSTVETLKGNKIEDYACSMYDQYKIGKYSMGVLILVSSTDKEVKVEIGEKLQKTITNSVSNRIQSSVATEYLKTNDLAQATVLAQSEIIDELKQNVPADWEERDKKNYNIFMIVFIIIFGGGTACCVYLCFSKEKD